MPALLVNIDVPDVIAAERFYCAAFGLRPGRRFDGAMELLGLASPIYLLQNAAGTQATPADSTRDYTRHWTPVHLDLAVDDLDEALALAVAAGALVERGPETRRWGRIAVLADPFGHGICLLQFLGEGYDAITV